MKFSGRNLKRRLYGFTTLPGRVARVRYFRGHGVHSPFVYAIVRQVFMKRTLRDGDHGLYDRLLALGLPARRAVQLQNLCLHCGYVTWAVDTFPEECDCCLLTPQVGARQTLEWVALAHRRGTTLVLLNPYERQERAALCRRIVEEHTCTTVDNRGYLLVFNNHLPKQHFRL